MMTGGEGMIEPLMNEDLPVDSGFVAFPPVCVCVHARLCVCMHVCLWLFPLCVCVCVASVCLSVHVHVCGFSFCVCVVTVCLSVCAREQPHNKTTRKLSTAQLLC